MFARTFLVIAIALGFIGTASAQPTKPSLQNHLSALFAYPPSTNVVEVPTTAPIPGARTVIQVFDLEGLHPEDSMRSSQAALNAAYAWEVAAQTKTLRDARYAFLQQRISDSDYTLAKLIVASEKLAPKIEARLFKTSLNDLDEEVNAWLAMFSKFRSAVADADATRIEVAEMRHFEECESVPNRTMAGVATCQAEIRHQQQEAQEIAESNSKLLEAFAQGNVDVYVLRQILQ